MDHADDAPLYELFGAGGRKEAMQGRGMNNKNPPLGANRGLKAAVLPRLVIAGGFLNCKARPEGRGIQPRALQ